MNKNVTFLFFVSLLFLSQNSYARYQSEFTPSASLSTLYDDNIDLDRTNEKSDLITSLSLGLNVNFTSPKNKFFLQYSPSIVRYKNQDIDDTIRHRGSLSYTGALSQDLIFEISDTYIRSEDPIEETEGIIGVRTTRKTYQRNMGSAGLSYSFGAEDVFSLGYRHQWLENSDISLDDGMVMDPYANLTYWFNVKHGVELSTDYTETSFTRDDNTLPGDDYSGFRHGVGYRYRLNPRTTASINYGYANRTFERSSQEYMVHEGSLGLFQKLSETASYGFSAGYFVRKNYTEDEDD
jgi:hypothetical protein